MRKWGFRHKKSEAKYPKVSVANTGKLQEKFRCTVQNGCEIISQQKGDFAAVKNSSFSLEWSASNGCNSFISFRSIRLLTSWASKRHIVCIKWTSGSASKVSNSWCPLEFFMLDFSLCFHPCIHDLFMAKDYKASNLRFSCKWASICFAMDSIELSSILDCFGDQITIKNTKTYTIWLETIAKVLNMLIKLKGNNYYSKVFKRVNYKLSNSTFWVVINRICSFIFGLDRI